VWTVLIGDEYEPEFLALLQEVQDETLVMTRLLLAIRPTAGPAERGHAQRLEIRPGRKGNRSWAET
jgi:hypothetical protein